jgi:uncharacterized protein with PIN domain
MAKKGKLKQYAKVKGIGKDCPKCKVPMETRERILPPKDKSYYYTQWDYCTQCGHVQHYEQYKSSDWQEVERQDQFMKSLF